MRLAVWGAGGIGCGVARRLTTMRSVSQVRWMNRSSVHAHVLDLEHGLSFAPSCHHISGHDQEEAPAVLSESDMVVLTLGEVVPKGGTRADAFKSNRDIYAETVIPVLKDFDGVILVVTNPVDLMAREIGHAVGTPSQRVIGLGTVVETARLRASLASHLRPWRRPSDIDAFAVGTHDSLFEPVAVRERLCPAMDPDEFVTAVEMARTEVAGAAARVKDLGATGTLHPIVEGVMAVVDAVATDRREILTVSSIDPESGFWYSVPCVVGRQGVIHRCVELMPDIDLGEALQALQDTLDS